MGTRAHRRARRFACAWVVASLAIAPSAFAADPPKPAAAPDADAPLTKMPVLSHFVEAPYPDGAVAKRAEAVVTLQIDIDALGSVESVSVVKQDGGEGFDFATAALEAAKRFHFEPAEAGDAPVPVRIAYKYKFVLPKLGGITGVVVDLKTNRPIDGARVVVTMELDGKWLKVERTTGADGRFTVDSLPLGAWKVQARAAGFLKQNATATVEADTKRDVRIALQVPSSNEYDMLVEEKEDDDAQKGRVYVDPSSVVPNTPSVSGVVVADTAGARGERGRGGRGGGRGGGGRGGGGGGGGFGGRGGGGGGGFGGGGGGEGGGRGGGFGRGEAVGTTGTVASGEDVVTVTTGVGGLDLRGQNPMNTRVVLDGVDIPSAYHFGVVRPIITAALLDDTTFYPGSFPIEYGDATAGLVVLKSNQSLATRTTGYVDANWADSSAMIRTPLTKDMTLSVSGQYSTLDHVMSAVIPDHSNIGLGGLPRYRDGEVKWIYQPTSTTKMQLLAVASQDEMIDWWGNTALNNPAPGTNALESQFYRAIFTSESSFGKDLTTRLVVGGGTDETSQPTPSFDVKTTMLQVRPSLRWKALDSFTIALGAEYLVDKLNGTLAGNATPNGGSAATTINLAQQTVNELGAYVGGEWQIFDDVKVFPGLRIDHYSQTDETVLDPRATIRWDMVKDAPGIERLTAKVSVGEYHQPPSLLQTDTQIGNPTSLTSADSIHYLAGLEYHPTKELLIDLDGFYVDEENVIVRSTLTQSGINGAGRVPQVWSNGGSGETRGVELFVQQELWKHLDGWLYYTFSVSDLSTTAGSDSVLSPYDQTHVLGTAASYSFPAGWKARVRFQYASGFPTTAVLGSVFDSSTNSYVSTPGTTLGDRTPAFSQLDARVDKTWSLGGSTRLTAYADVRNVYNRANVVAPYTYNYNYSQAYARTGIPILPMVGLRADF